MCAPHFLAPSYATDNVCFIVVIVITNVVFIIVVDNVIVVDIIIIIQIKSNQKVLFKVGTFYNNQHKLSRAFQTDMHSKLHKFNTAQ